MWRSIGAIKQAMKRASNIHAMKISNNETDFM